MEVNAVVATVQSAGGGRAMPVLHIAAMLANIKARYIHHVKAMADGEGTPIFFMGEAAEPRSWVSGRAVSHPPEDVGLVHRRIMDRGRQAEATRAIVWAEYPWSSLHSHTTAEWALTRRDLSSDKLVCWPCWSRNVK